MAFMSSVRCETSPNELTASVARDAMWDADAVVEFLRVVEERSGEIWERPVHFPAAFLLGAGAALRLASWENVGLHPHRAVGLDDASAVFRQMAGWCLQLAPAE